MVKINQNRLDSIESNQGLEAKERVKPYSVDGEVNSYDFCLPERVVTPGWVQFRTLMVSENVQGNLNKEQTIFAEDKCNPFMGGGLNARNFLFLMRQGVETINKFNILPNLV